LILSEPTLSGTITRAVANSEGALLAVATTLPLLTSPPSRAAYKGQKLRQRLALYRRGERVPFAWLDDLKLPINDVSFHPTKPLIAIAAGSYDGGWMFDGDLVFWDWQTGHFWRPFDQVPEVVRCDFSDTGDDLDLLVRPWDEEWGCRGEEDDPFGHFYPLTIATSEIAGVTLELDTGPGLRDIDDYRTDSIEDSDLQKRLTDWFCLPDIQSRGAIWDVSWMDEGKIGAVHDGCLLETYDLETAEQKIFQGEGRGVAILNSTPPLIAVALGEPRQAVRSKVQAFVADALVDIAELEGAYNFGSATNGYVLGRLDRHQAGASKRDVLIHVATGEVRPLDLGHYDCFNHHLGIDGAPDLFFLQGTPASSHEGKRLCRLSPDGKVDSLWPILDPKGRLNHAMDCCGCYLQDAAGEAVVIAGRYYGARPPHTGFLYRRSLSGKREVWRHVTDASASAIAAIPDHKLIAAAFLNGTLCLLDAESGAIVASRPLTVDGVPTVVFALDAKGDALALGTFDGRVAILQLSELLGENATSELR